VASAKPVSTTWTSVTQTAVDHATATHQSHSVQSVITTAVSVGVRQTWPVADASPVRQAGT